MSRRLRLLLGVDGGQSATVAAVADEKGQILGEGEAGPCNHTRAKGGVRKFERALRGSIQAAWRRARLQGAPQFAAACLGFSGGAADKRELVHPIVRARKIYVTTDAEIALAGATGGEPGIVVIAGTGSIAYGRNRAGETARAGGWGYLFGDEGGAFDIVRQALRAVLLSEEGRGVQTRLTEALLETTGAATVDELLHLFYTADWPRDRIAALAPLVDRAAEQGDAAARRILSNAGASLAELALGLRRRLFAGRGHVLITYAGGVFESRSVRRAFERRVPCEPARLTPVQGAVLISQRLLRV
ncbi:MAG: BadF/BadG/BcrA/BcrD ATPase family protein [Bryobacteraceae bacterium]